MEAEDWLTLFSNPRVREAVAMPPMLLRAGGAALRVVEEVSWMPQQVPPPWRAAGALGVATTMGSSPSSSFGVEGRGGAGSFFGSPPSRAPPLTGQHLLALGIQSGLASCILWHPKSFWSPSRTVSCDVQRIPSASARFIQDASTLERRKGERREDMSSSSTVMESNGEEKNEAPAEGRRGGAREKPMEDDVPLEVIADGITAFCGAIDVVFGTMRVATFLDAYIPPEGGNAGEEKIH